MLKNVSTSTGQDLLEVVGGNAAVSGPRVAFTNGGTGQSVTFAAMAGRARRLLSQLHRAAIGEGDTVACVIDRDPGFLPLLTACAALGAKLLPIPPGLHPAERRPLLDHCGPKLPTLYIYPGPRGRTVKPWFT